MILVVFRWGMYTFVFLWLLTAITTPTSFLFQEFFWWISESDLEFKLFVLFTALDISITRLHWCRETTIIIGIYQSCSLITTLWSICQRVLCFQSWAILFVVNLIYFDLAEIFQEEVQLIWKDEWLSISINSQFLLAMTQKVAKINMEELSCLILKHKVSWMPISYSKHICCHTLASQRL